MTYFSLNVIGPLEHRFVKTTEPILIEASRVVGRVRRKWFKYMMVAVVGICMTLNVAYIVRKFGRRETKLTTTFHFANSTTRLPFPGLRLCIPQIFQLSRLSKQELMYLYRNERAEHQNYTQWIPPLESVLLHLMVNGRSLKPSSVFVNRHDKFYKVCWQTSRHELISRSPGTLQSIDMILNVAEYEDIVHPSSIYLRHVEIGPFDQNTEINVDPINAIYLSPGRHSLVTLRTIKEDSTVRPKNSVACVNQVDHEICQQTVEQSYINRTCLGRNMPQNVSIETYVKCMRMSTDGRKLCSASCTRTFFKSFKSEAKLKFAKNLGNMLIHPKMVDAFTKRLHKAVELHSTYDSDYRRGVDRRLPAFITSTRTVQKLLSQQPVLECTPPLPEVNFLSDFPNVRHQFSVLKANTHVHITMGRKYRLYSENHYHAGIKSYYGALNNKEGLDFYYTHFLSIGHSDNLINANEKWRQFVEQHGRNLSIGYDMLASLPDYVDLHHMVTDSEVKSTILKSPSYKTKSIMMREETGYMFHLDRNMDCHGRGGIQVPFTNNWAKTSDRYLLINDTRLDKEAWFGNAFLRNWYKKMRVLINATGIPIYIDHTSHNKVLVPKIALYHCAFYKTRSDIFEKQLGLDRQFSYTNTNARYKVNAHYTLFVLNNILQTDDRWGVRPSQLFDICEEESCACNIAVSGEFLGPLHLSRNSTYDQILHAARQRTMPNMMRQQLNTAIFFYKGIQTCGMKIDVFERSAVRYFKYFENTIIKQHDSSIETLMKFARSYETVRKGRRLRDFGYLLRTYGLKRRIKRLHSLLHGVMLGGSFEQMSTFLVKKGKIMVGEVQLVLYDLSRAYAEYLDYFRRNRAAVHDVSLIISLNPVSEDAFFLADIFNSTAKTMLRNEILKLPRLVELMKTCMLHSNMLLDKSYLPLHRALMEWLSKVNYFLWRAKVYTASKEISQSFMDSNIAVVSIFYETLDIRYETNTLRYSAAKYKSDWGNILTFYYGLEAFSFLQLLTFTVAVAIPYVKKWRK